MYEVCIFDLDGTLTDTLESLTISVNETLTEMNLPNITSEQCRKFVGSGARVLMEKALKISGDENCERIDEAMVRYGRIFNKNCTYHVLPYEGIGEMLSCLKEMGVHMAVLSNKPHMQTETVVKTIFGEDTFELIQGQKEGIPRKPDPAAVLDILKALDSSPEKGIYVGDSEVDIATGRAASMLTVGVTWGFRDEIILKESGAEHIVSKPDEIIQIIKGREVKNHE